jgi:hypothetical protein
MPTIPASVTDALRKVFPGDSDLATERALVAASTLRNIAAKAASGELSAEDAAALVESQRQETVAAALEARIDATVDMQNTINQMIDLFKEAVIGAAKKAIG